MKKVLLLLFYCFALSFCCFSQDCPVLFKSAMDLFEKGDYENARTKFALVVEKCGNGGDYKGALGKIKECDEKLKAKLEVGKREVTFDPQGGSETVRVSSGGASWSFGKAPEWLNLSKSKGQLVIECESNASGEERNADITLSCGEGNNKVTKKIHVTQDNSVLRLSTTSLSFPEHGSASYRVRVSCNDNWNVTNYYNWIRVTKEQDGVSVSCEANTKAKERQGSFSIVTSNNVVATVNVAQDPARFIFELETTSIRVKWNEGGRAIEINTNDPDWTADLYTGGSWCKPKKRNDHELWINMDDNETGSVRSATIKVTVADKNEYITVTQQSHGYKALYDEYFDNAGGSWRITTVSASVYGGGSWGLRVSGLMVRWKVVELDLLNLNTSFSKSYLLSWEPMLRGYLPLQGNGRGWTAYLGVGGCVPIVDKPLKEGNKVSHSKMVLEAGTEFKWKDNMSSRVFIRIDGYFSVGMSFDLYKWR